MANKTRKHTKTEKELLVVATRAIIENFVAKKKKITNPTKNAKKNKVHKWN